MLTQYFVRVFSQFLGEYKPPDMKFDGDTTYSKAFMDRGPPTLAKISRPKTVTTKPGAKFHSETTHNQTFTPKVPIYQAPYGEVPSFTGSILFPDKKGAFDAKTCNQEVYQGKFVPRADTLKPRHAQIKIGTEGDHDLRTEHMEAFKTPEVTNRQQAVARPSKLGANQKRAKFQGDTQSRSDFPGFGGKMPPPPKPIPPPPARVDLTMNNERAFETTNDVVYKVNWDPKTLERTKMLRPDDKPYTPPKVKFAVTTQSKEDFKAREAPQVAKIRPPSRIEPSKAKFSSETAYNTQFKPHANVPYVRYGDFHESAVYLKPVTKFFQDGSVTTQDFKGAVGGRPSTTFKPVQELAHTEGSMENSTMYRDAFGRKNLPECSYLKWVSERQAKKGANHVTTVAVKWSEATEDSAWWR